MSRGTSEKHRRDGDFVIDLSGLSNLRIASPEEIDAAIHQDLHRVYDAGKEGQHIGKMTIADFLSKFG
jgi:hypothetical protein